MTTTPALASKLDILKETRQLFAETHWTSGDLYTVDDQGKKKFCMVGGLCHVTAKNNLPEWLEKQEEKAKLKGYEQPATSFYMYELEKAKKGISDIYGLLEYDYELFISGLDAEWELAKTICELEGKRPLSKDASPEEVENIIVDWNDGTADDEFEMRGDASYVLEVMDQTIERVEAESTE